MKKQVLPYKSVSAVQDSNYPIWLIQVSCIPAVAAAFNVAVVAYSILSRLLYLAFSATRGLLGIAHTGIGPLV